MCVCVSIYTHAQQCQGKRCISSADECMTWGTDRHKTAKLIEHIIVQDTHAHTHTHTHRDIRTAREPI